MQSFSGNTYNAYNSRDFDQELKRFLNDVNTKYGEILFNELLNRLEKNIIRFQNEVGRHVTCIHHKNNNQDTISELVKFREKPIDNSNSNLEVSEWEYKLQQ
ncbi:MAG: hypothetical protein HN729_11385 [Candidatus Marinimicrobia bacterium]|jgi:hypothetical protein|nr:hypothetical protein [Candidatus Neomarinimicrobiota bacterium]MBT3683302.1 hypothetical protein [Candidatus Neomarinimicrobiota bacterium]MBT3760191.1 hypothetical protein [Candidatus Neomarinimicrobiota bacterium]MBT3896286.1 hypothetical protein [Candidatus Neomarinimicrobiota bacterium]MBT4173334.1 hypothetical protein [Candidatus Neomarinimicrobiota bacterium]